MKEHIFVNVIGCGYAGVECGLLLANLGIKVHVFDGLEGYHYTCKNCYDNKKLPISEQIYNEVLKKELALLCSPLIREEELLKKSDFKGCKAGEILNICKEKLKRHKNVEYFNISISDINPKEINIITTGQNSNKEIYNYLLNRFGSMKCINYKNSGPIFSNVNEKNLYQLSDESYALPLGYKDYINFINRVVRAVNENISTGNFSPSDHSLEGLVCQSKDALKNFAFTPIGVDGFSQRPYAVVRLKKEGDYFSICKIGSRFDNTTQEEIFRILPGFEKANLIVEAKNESSVQLLPKYTVNKYCQSQTDKNLFFAGSILGLEGYERCIASGHYVAREVFRRVLGFDFMDFPKNSLINDVNNKIFDKNSLNFNEKCDEYDIICWQRDENKYQLIEKFFKNSSDSLARFKEEYLYGKHF